MSEQRFVSTIFCDDIRMEVGNKPSLMGCYSSDMYVQSLPFVLPKFCALVKAFTPIDRPYIKLVTRILRDDVTLGEFSFHSTDLENVATAPEFHPGAHYTAVPIHFVLTPFAIDNPCRIRVEVETEDATLYGGSIWIGLPPSTGFSNSNAM